MLDHSLALTLLRAYEQQGSPFTTPDGSAYRVDRIAGENRFFKLETRQVWSWFCDGSDLLEAATGHRVSRPLCRGWDAVDNFRNVERTPEPAAQPARRGILPKEGEENADTVSA